MINLDLKLLATNGDIQLTAKRKKTYIPDKGQKSISKTKTKTKNTHTLMADDIPGKLLTQIIAFSNTLSTRDKYKACQVFSYQ